MLHATSLTTRPDAEYEPRDDPFIEGSSPETRRDVEGDG